MMNLMDCDASNNKHSVNWKYSTDHDHHFVVYDEIYSDNVIINYFVTEGMIHYSIGSNDSNTVMVPFKGIFIAKILVKDNALILQALLQSPISVR